MTDWTDPKTARDRTPYLLWDGGHVSAGVYLASPGDGYDPGFYLLGFDGNPDESSDGMLRLVGITDIADLPAGPLRAASVGLAPIPPSIVPQAQVEMRTVVVPEGVGNFEVGDPVAAITNDLAHQNSAFAANQLNALSAAQNARASSLNTSSSALGDPNATLGQPSATLGAIVTPLQAEQLQTGETFTPLVVPERTGLVGAPDPAATKESRRAAQSAKMKAIWAAKKAKATA